MADGWLILDKPVGLGSTQAVAAVKRALRQAGWPKAKVGHGGTLDPLASGVLPIAVGEATKLTGRLLAADKGYEFTVAFGAETATLDAEGEVIREAPLPTREAVQAAIRAHRGELSQVPPAYSALKVEGRRAYDLARAGEAVQLEPRRIVVRDLLPADRLGGVDRDERLATAQLQAVVSKGTYIRSLARDIAGHAGSAGHVTALRRTKAGPFTLAHAVSLDKLDEAAKAGRLQELILPLRAGLADIPVLALTLDQARALRQGRTLFGIAGPPGLTLATLGTAPVALVEVGTETKVVRGFNPMSETNA